MRKILILFSLVLLYGGCHRNLWLNVDPARHIKSVYNRDEVATIQNYDQEYQVEQKVKLEFPLEPVEKATFSKGLLRSYKELHQDSVMPLLKLLNDTASYEWGEIGTYNPDMKILFFNSNNEVIGLLEMESNGERQTTIKPYLKRTKWGYLKNSVYLKILELIEASK